MASRHSLPGNIGTPGVYIHEVSGGSRPIEAVGSSTAGIVGVSPASAKSDADIQADALEAKVIDNWTQFKRDYFSATKPEDDDWTNLAHAVYGFFLNGGSRCWIVDMGNKDNTENQLEAALNMLATVDEIAILAAPGFTGDAFYEKMATHVENMKDRVFIMDAPQDQDTAAKLSAYAPGKGATQRGFATMYAPWLQVADPKPGKDADGLAIVGSTVTVPPSGHVAGIWARNDATRGVHKAPANEIVQGALGLTHNMSSQTQHELNNKGINAIRYFRDSGFLVWGARTLATDQEWRYLNVRRLFNMIEESIAESTRWIVFEPNDELLWASIRRDVGAFLNDLWQQGMLMGTAPEQAFFVKCDAENNPPDSIRNGRVIIDIGVAPVLPAEFIIFRITQYEAGTDVEIS
ncbi:MAG: phage tail sheath family protein [Chloroflexi bacterium]|nr:MAG: phage tail sheath family protein [Chloroflexota bacterium]